MSGEVKPVQQIVAEWQAIETARPGGRLPSVDKLMQFAADAGSGVSDRQKDLLEVVVILHNTLAGYHAEMGVLINALTAPAPRTKSSPAEAFQRMRDLTSPEDASAMLQNALTPPAPASDSAEAGLEGVRCAVSNAVQALDVSSALVRQYVWEAYDLLTALKAEEGEG